LAGCDEASDPASCEGVEHGSSRELIRYKSPTPSFGEPCIGVAIADQVCTDGEWDTVAGSSNVEELPAETCEQLLPLVNIGDATGTLESGGRFFSKDSGFGFAFGEDDNFAFWHEPIVGDFEILLRGEGLMIREGLSSRARFVAVNHHLLFRTKKGAAADAKQNPGAKVDVKPSYRMSRIGNTISVYHSEDGKEWEQADTFELEELPETVHVGVFVSSDNLEHSSGAELSDYQVVGL